MPSYTRRSRVSRLRKGIAAGLLAAALGITGAPAGNLFVDHAAAGKKKDSGTVSAYGKKVRR
jgi:hypothetical protein